MSAPAILRPIDPAGGEQVGGSMDSMERSLDIDFRLVQELGNELLVRINTLRDAAPVYWSELNQAWIVSGHAEVAQAFSGALPLSNRRFATLSVAAIPEAERAARIPLLAKSVPHWVVNMDPPEHTRLRKLLVRAFSRPVVEAQRPAARGLIDEVLDSSATGAEVEFVEQVARPITALNLLRLIGFADDYLPRMRDWARVLNGAFGGLRASPDVLVAAEAAFAQIREVLAAEFARRRADPGHDFLSMLVTGHDEGETLEEEELIGICVIALVAGHDTTLNSMSLGVAALATHPAARAHLRSHPDTAAQSVLELMRFVAMSTTMPRSVTRDFEWSGQQLRAGQFVYLMIAGANRDPRVFTEPDTLDMTRVQDRNMMFAPGIHHCIGHLFARMQLNEFFPALLEKVDDIELLEPRLAFGPHLGFRSLEHLRVRLHPRAARSARDAV